MCLHILIKEKSIFFFVVGITRKIKMGKFLFFMIIMLSLSIILPTNDAKRSRSPATLDGEISSFKKHEGLCFCEEECCDPVGSIEDENTIRVLLYTWGIIFSVLGLVAPSYYFFTEIERRGNRP